jgi:hypothetical protein
MAVPELQFHQAPQANLKTWSAVSKLFLISALVTAALLLLLFLALV